MSAGSSSRGPVVVGLDVGTTGVKAAAFNLTSGARHVEGREYPLRSPAPGQEVQDPDEMLDASLESVAGCVAAAAGAEVVGISLSTAMHGLLALDGDLRPLTPLLTWADSRASAQARELRSSGQAAELHRITGAPVHPMTPLTKLRWYREEEPDLWRQARWWVGLKDYLLLRLTGRLVTELSSASGTGMLDMTTRSWSPLALDVAGVSADQLPPILPTTATLPLDPEAAASTGLPPGLPVVTGAGDGPLGNLGAGAVDPGVAGLSVGTSGAVRMVVPGPQVDDDGALFCYALTDDAWVVGAAVSNGGVVVRWASEALAPDVTAARGAGVDEELLDLAASAPPGSDGLVMLPYLLGERAPLWDPDLTGAYLGLRRGHTRAHLIRAAVEGVCRQLAVLTDRLDAVAPISSVRITGGVFRSALWREVLAASLSRPLQVVAAAEGSALGAAALGLLALDRATDLSDAVARLDDPDDPPPRPVDPDVALAATYREVRAGIPALLASLQDVGPIFAAQPSRDRAPARPQR